MADTMVTPNNKPTMQLGGVKKRNSGGPSATVPSATAEAAGAVKKAKGMLKRGLISQGQHDALVGKANKLMGMSAGPAPSQPGQPVTRAPKRAAMDEQPGGDIV